MKRLFVLIVFGLGMTSAVAQQLVTGKLIREKDGQPVMYVNVSMLRASDSTFLRGTVTDDKGVYTIENDTVETMLRISGIGYETEFVAVPATRYGGPTGLGKIDMGVTKMKEGAMLLEQVRVVEKRPLYTVDGEKDLYNVGEDATIQTGNASDALQNAPGVEVDVEGNVTLNGSSVTVWINDRPSHLEGEALKQYIKTLPANSIDRIEVIKNPSARYGSNGPVVNIVTSQRMLQNSFVSFGANGSSRPSLSPWVSYVYGNDKFHISAYVSYNGSNNVSRDTTTGQMRYDSLHLSREWKSVSQSTRRHHNSWINLNADYQFDSMNSISGWLGAYPGMSRSKTDGVTERTEFVPLGFVPEDYGYMAGWRDTSYNHGGFGGVWFTHKFDNKGHQYSVSLNGNWWGYGSKATSWQHYNAQPQMTYDERTGSRSLNGNGSLGFDYSVPYSENGEIETGVDISRGTDYSYSLRDTMDAEGNYLIDVLRSDSSRSTNSDASAYVTWRRKWGGFTLKLGARVRYDYSTSRHLYDERFDTSASDVVFIPSIHLSYSTKDMHNFSLSYRMGKSYPGAELLSRYEEYGVESYSTGNPDLGPSYQHNVEASWNKYFMSFGSVGVSGSFKADQDKRGSLSDARYVEYFGRVVSFSKPYNLGDTRRGDLNVNVMYRPSGLFNVRLTCGVSDSWYRLQVRPGEWVEDEMASWSIRVRLWTKLWNKLEVFASGNYSSRGHSPWSLMEVNESRKGIDLGASADFWNRKLSLYLNISDIFNWNNWGSTSTNYYNSSTSVYKWNSRYITFGVTLRFGKMELESRAKTGATEDSGGR